MRFGRIGNTIYDREDKLFVGSYTDFKLQCPNKLLRVYPDIEVDSIDEIVIVGDLVHIMYTEKTNTPMVEQTFTIDNGDDLVEFKKCFKNGYIKLLDIYGHNVAAKSYTHMWGEKDE